METRLVAPEAILLLMQPEQEVINRWTGSAPYWEKHRDVIRQMFAPVTQALVEDGQIGTGHVVLDIATGPGEPALSVAGRVGPNGKVFGIDPIPEMVAAARRAADRLELRNVQFDVAFADKMPFPADTFDAVISRFGVMFFPSPVDGVREIHSEADANSVSVRLLQFTIQAAISFKYFYTLRIEMSEKLHEKIAWLS